MEKFFKLKENGTTVRTEIVAGLTTFMTMAYIIALNPNLLTGFGANGQDLWNAVFMATCIASAIGIFCMAFLANKPFAMAPGMGLNSFFAVVVANIAGLTGMTYVESFQSALVIILVEGIIFLILSILNIRENTVISSLGKHKRFGVWLSSKSMKKDTQWSIDAMHTKTPSQETKIRSLSGGNQQKVIIGRWLLTEPDVLLLDEPTRGIDVGAKYEIYQLILDLANKGKTVLMVSSEMPELLGVCDRILVMSGGRLAGEVDAKNTTQEQIMSLAAKYV